MASFDGGAITPDAGALLLREVERECGIIKQFASCSTDHRAQPLVKHSARELAAQRVFALNLGNEDLYCARLTNLSAEQRRGDEFVSKTAKAPTRAAILGTRCEKSTPVPNNSPQPPGKQPSHPPTPRV